MAEVAGMQASRQAGKQGPPTATGCELELDTRSVDTQVRRGFGGVVSLLLKKRRSMMVQAVEACCWRSQARDSLEWGADGGLRTE